jgi:hypothetical protein
VVVFVPMASAPATSAGATMSGREREAMHRVPQATSQAREAGSVSAPLLCQPITAGIAQTAAVPSARGRRVTSSARSPHHADSPSSATWGGTISDAGTRLRASPSPQDMKTSSVIG